MLGLLAPGLLMGGGTAAPPTVTVSAVITFAPQFPAVQDTSAAFANVQSKPTPFSYVQTQDVGFSKR